MRYECDISEEEETVAFAEDLAPLLEAGDLLILSGGLGAGKTFLTRALCYALGLSEDERVTSPTYTLVHEIPTQPPVIHADLYRLHGPAEVYDLGLDERRQGGDILIIEWGRPYAEALGGDAIYVDLELEPRRAKISGDGPRVAQVVGALKQALKESE